jgi:hypothetical protein
MKLNKKGWAVLAGGVGTIAFAVSEYLQVAPGEEQTAVGIFASAVFGGLMAIIGAIKGTRKQDL